MGCSASWGLLIVAFLVGLPERLRFLRREAFNPPVLLPGQEQVHLRAVLLLELELLAVPPAYTFWWSFGDGTTSTSQNPQHAYTNNGSYTVVLVVSDGLSTATNTVLVTVAPPVLAVVPGAAGELVLAWPAWATAYNLYPTTNLTPPVAWSEMTNAVSASGGTNTLTIPIGTGNRFFQLRTGTD